MTYDLGSKDPDKRTYLNFSAPWEDPPTDCPTGSDSPSNITDSGGGTTSTDPPITQDPSDGTPTGTNDDPEFQPGTGDSDGTETDNGALRDIKTNTGRAADSLDKIGDYLKDMNAGIQNTLRNQIKTREEQKEKEAADEEIAGAGKSAAEGWDPESHYPESIFNGNLTEGAEGDYENPGDLSSESWLSTFVSSNPLVNAFNNSGFQSSGSVCEMTLNLGSLGTHQLSLCDFRSEFAAAGNLLLAFCGLTSLIIVVRG